MCEKKSIISAVQAVFSNMSLFLLKLSIRVEATTQIILSYMSFRRQFWYRSQL